MNINTQRNHLASILYCDMLKGEDFDSCESAADDSLYAADVFIRQATTYDEREAAACQCTTPEPIDQRVAERRQAERRQGECRGAEPKVSAETSPEEDEAFTRLEQALKA